MLPYRATAEHEGRVLADSTATRRVDHPDAAPELWFPLADVVRDLPDGDLWRSGTPRVRGRRRTVESEVFDIDPCTRAERHSTFNHMGEFTHVAWPGVLL